MPITDEQIQKFKHYYEAKTTNYACPVCGMNDWQPGHIVLLPRLDAPTRGYPALPVRCNNCQYTRLFNAQLMGLIESLTEWTAAPPRLEV